MKDSRVRFLVMIVGAAIVVASALDEARYATLATNMGHIGIAWGGFVAGVFKLAIATCLVLIAKDDPE